MRRTLPSIIAGVAIVLILGLYMVTYQVRFNEVALVRTWGKIQPPEPREIIELESSEAAALDEGQIPSRIRKAIEEHPEYEGLSEEATCLPAGKVWEIELPESVDKCWRIADGEREFLVCHHKDDDRIVMGDLNDLVSPHVKLKPGLYWRWPWPIQRVQKYDYRKHIMDMIGEETQTQDEKNIIVTTAIAWRIAEPYQFSIDVGDVETAQDRLTAYMKDIQKTVIGSRDFSNFVSTNSAELQYEEIETEMFADLKDAARRNLGIQIEFLGLKRLVLPERITENVFSAMKEERNAKAAQYTSEGESQADRIRAEADAIAETIKEFASLKAADIIAQGKERAAAYNEVFAQEESLAIFLLKLEYLGRILKDRTTLILEAKPPFDLLKEGDWALPDSGAPGNTTTHVAEPGTVLPN